MTCFMLPFSVSHSKFDCAFEKNFCHWIQDRTDQFNWRRLQGPTGSLVTGPLTDHTYGKSKNKKLDSSSDI